ncbi:MAG: DNA-formamidopyrimidine glycosylase [Dehalococcoidales bacterium]|nr:DNA-formamidopyrimidine glycosylase [Dehalococcoidales bacterium]
MPELPEVETIVAGLRPLVGGRCISDTEIHWSGSVGGMDPAVFRDRLVGQCIARMTRRGKFILLYLDGGDVLLVHLRMTGRLLLRPREAEADPYTRVIIGLEGNEELRLADLRKFARLVVVSQGEEEAVLAKLGPEPLSEDFTVEHLANSLGKRKAPIKTLLLDQTVLAGLGNIYADEALYLAGLHPLRRADSLSVEEWQRLHEAIRRTLEEGIRNRGTTFSQYRDGEGRPGGHQHCLNVYRRTGEACPRCGGPIERLVIGGRSSHFCPRCQV